MADIEERFFNWTKYKRLSKSYFNYDDGLNFAADTFIKSNGSRRNISRNDAEKKYTHARTNRNELEFPPRVEESIQNHLHQLDQLAISEDETLNDNGEPLVQAVRDAQGDLEPSWSGTRIANPAELLLPTDHRLFVTTEGPEILYPFQENLEEEYTEDIPSSRNNLGCSYGGYYFIVATDHLLIYESDNLYSPIQQRPYIAEELLEDQFDYYHMTNEDQWDSDDESTDGSSTTANYICTKRLFDRDVLIICDTNALALFFDLESIVKEVKYGLPPTLVPTVALKVPKSCWSVDVINMGDTAFVAVGHNLPGVSLFALSRTQKLIKEKDDIKIISREIISEHNVPSLTFIRPDHGIPKSVSLVFGSIFGNITTIKIDTDISGGTIDAEVIDIQFLADEVWTVTALKKNDFLSVPQFELLNLNFKEAVKNSIQKSIIMDSKVLNLQPRSIYHSGEYGIGTLTTQIPVPVSNLRWLCMNGVQSDRMKLNFTTFDREGMVSEGILATQPGDSDLSFIPLSHRPYNSLQRLSSVSENDELKFTFKYEESQMVYRNENPSVHDIWKNANLEIKSTSDVPNLTKYNGFTIFTEDDEFNFDNNDNTEQRNREYFPKNSTSESILAMHEEALIHESSTYFDRMYKPQSWKDISHPDLKVADRPVLFEHNVSLIPDLSSHRDWWVHNHALKVKKLLEYAVPGYEPCGFKLPDHNNDILFITTHHSVILARPYPLIVTSYAIDDIFPLDSVSVCINVRNLIYLNRINFVCHIKELNCIAVASQIGLISLLRLTEFRGIYSFRQEYIIGWNSQLPFDEDDPACIRESMFGDPHDGSCQEDDIVLPLAFIRGMGYKYYPEDESAGTIEHAELIVSFQHNRQKFKIFAGDKIGNSC